MKMKKTQKFLVFATIFLVLVSGFVAAQEQNPEDEFEFSEDYLSAQSYYEDLIKNKDQMKELNISVVRYSDSLLLVEDELERLAQKEKDLFNATQEEKENMAEPDFTVVYDRLDEVAELHAVALQTYDELVVLEDFLKENNYLEDNATRTAYENARNSFENERYDEALLYIETAREKASEYDALNTKVKALVAASSRNVKSFMQQNWPWVISGLILFILVFIIVKRIVHRALTKRKIKQLTLRKQSIQEITKKIQKEYFKDGTLSESAYHIRLKVYGEMVRDIRRQIPLLEEELVLHKNIFSLRSKSKQRKEKKKERKKSKKSTTKDDGSSKKPKTKS